MTDRRRLADLGVLIALAAVYFVAGKLGLMLAFAHPSASPMWPPTGLALAALLLLGFRVWPAVLLGAFLVNFTNSGDVGTSLGIAAGNTLEAVVGAHLVNTFAQGRYAFDRPEGVLKWALVAGLIATLISATFGVTSLCLGGLARWTDYGYIWLTWWLGDAASALIVAPLVLLWAAKPRVRWSRGQMLEAALLVLSVLVIGAMVFAGMSPFENARLPLAFLCIPLLVWAAYRLGQRETATAACLLAVIAIWGTLRGLGPFGGESPNESLLLLQGFMGVSTMTAMTLAAAIAERRRFEAQLAHLADHDALTDLLSRRGFQVELNRHLAEAGRDGTVASLLFLDLDDFKQINDRFGHGAGDELLVQLATLLRELLRDSDLLARLGGDEFAIFLPRTGGEHANALAGRVLAAIRSHPLVLGKPAGISASIGIALFPAHGTSLEELFAQADSALYQAKRAGRDCFRVGVLDASAPREIVDSYST